MEKINDIQQPSLKALLLSRKTAFVLYILAALITAVTEIGLQLGLAALPRAFQGPGKEIDTRWLLISAALFIAPALGQLLSRFMRIGYMRDILLDLRKLSFRKILTLPQSAFSHTSREEKISHLVNDVNLFESEFFVSLLNMLFSSIRALIGAAILFVLDWRVALAAVASALLLGTLAHFFSERIVVLKTDISTLNGLYQSAISNLFRGLELLKLNRVEERFYEKARQDVKNLEKGKARYRWFLALQERLLWTLGSIVMMAGLIFVSFAVLARDQDLSRALLFTQLLNVIVYAVAMFLPHYNSFKASSALYERMVLFSDEELKAVAAAEQNEKNGLPFHFNETIELRKVSFSFTQKPILKHVSLCIHKGEHILLRGPSGAGKSSFFNLLTERLLPDEGEILIDGIPLSSFRQSELASAVAEIDQDVFLFEDTIEQNIVLYGEVDPEKLERVIQEAGLTDLIASLPQGLATPLSENGKNLSGGERQRISIARALYKDADVFLADEATASLDPQLGEAIERTLLGLDKTLIAISHRDYPGVSEGYDRVLYLAEGDMEEIATERYFAEVRA